MLFFLARAFWLPLTTRTCNQSTDLILTFNLVFNPGFLYYLGYKNNNNNNNINTKIKA